MISNIFINNSALKNGSAIEISTSSSNIFIVDNKFSENWASHEFYGSTINLQDPGNISILNCIFSNNKGVIGAAIYYEETSMKKIN